MDELEEEEESVTERYTRLSRHEKLALLMIDLGPEGGANGVNLLAEGTPEFVAKSKKSSTAEFLKSKLT